MEGEQRKETKIKENVLKLYGVNFPLFKKIEVNGKNTHEVYRFLR